MARMKTQTQAPAPEPKRGRGRPRKPAPPPEPKRGRGRPRSTTPQAPKPRNPNRKVRKDKGVRKAQAPAPPPIYIDIGGSIDSNSKGGDSPAIDLKSKMTVKELSFLSSYLSGGVTVIQAMDSAGYGDYHENARYQLARKIIQKYETQAPDHRNIFRAMGAGEVAVVEGLLNLAQKGKSEAVRLNAWSMIAKCIGLTKDQVESAGGITIIFEAADKPALAPGAPPALPGGEPRPAAGLPGPLKPLQITR